MSHDHFMAIWIAVALLIIVAGNMFLNDNCTAGDEGFILLMAAVWPITVIACVICIPVVGAIVVGSLLGSFLRK
jgi:hypothetical protein